MSCRVFLAWREREEIRVNEGLRYNVFFTDPRIILLFLDHDLDSYGTLVKLKIYCKHFYCLCILKVWRNLMYESGLLDIYLSTLWLMLITLLLWSCRILNSRLSAHFRMERLLNVPVSVCRERKGTWGYLVHQEAMEWRYCQTPNYHKRQSAKTY